MLGLHCLSATADTLRIRPGVVKLVDLAFGMVNDLPATTLVVGRAYEPFDPLSDWYPGRPAILSAQDWFNRQWPRIQANPKIKVWQNVNEPNCDTPERAAWLSDFSIRLMELMEVKGLKCVLGCFGTGRPPLPTENGTWAALLPMLQRAAANGHYLGLDEYSWPHMQDAQTYLCLRYRRVYAWLPVDARPALIIMECGIDGGVNYTGRPSGGGAFRDSEWRDRWGQGNPEETYFQQLKWYNEETRHDPYVKGICVYTCGDDGHWAAFDIAGTSLVDKLATYNAAGDVVVPPPPPPLPPPPLTTLKRHVLVSHWQNDRGPIDWVKVRDSGIHGVDIKATEGTGYKDPYYLRNRDGAAGVGLARRAFHFFRPGQDVKLQVDNFLGYTGGLYDLPSELDFEAGPFQGVTEKLAEWFRRYDRQAQLYTRAELWNANVPPSDLATQLAREHPLHVAHYGVAKPTLPREWIPRGYEMWQDTETGLVPGIVGRVALSWYRDDVVAPPPPVVVPKLRLLPPTIRARVNQWFGDNPEYYAQFGLPGHEGIDFDADTDDLVYAPTRMLVIQVREDHPSYGVMVRGLFEWMSVKYELTLAHGAVSSIRVQTGSVYFGGDVLMSADSSGNSTGFHCHVTLKNLTPGFMYVDPLGRRWPYGIIDPTDWFFPVH